MYMNSKPGRIVSIDILRGIVMVLMALDHARDYFSNFTQNPTDLSVTTPGMFMTRWITHFCAPVFIFLAGTSAYLSRKSSKKEKALFLLKRGLFLVLLEFTVVRFGWFMNLDYSFVVFQVIWAIGCSMIFLSALVYLPMSLILFIGLAMIFGHNLLDSIHAAETGNNILWHFIHERGFVQVTEQTAFLIIYPLVPWLGVMAAGYCFGIIARKEERQRNRSLYLIGGGAILLFIILRFTNVYGDPAPWRVQETGVGTFLSFINCEKYPPSLLYLLMTLGPAILSLPLLEKMGNGIGRFFTVYGRVPMLYYILHIYLLHIMAILFALFMNVPVHYFTDNRMLFAPKPGWGFSLAGVYAAWLIAVLLLYIPCRWYMYRKLNEKKWWMSYL